MIIYFAGSEDVDFSLTGGAVCASAGGYDTALVRASINVTGTSTTWPLANFGTANFGSQSSFWFHAGIQILAAAGATGSIFFALADAGGVGRLFVRSTGTVGQLKLSKRNAAGTFTDLVTSAANIWTANSYLKFDLFVNYAVSGRATLYLNGASIADTGAGVDVTTDSATSLANLYMGATSGSTSGWWSEVIVADSDTRNLHLWLMNSSTAGNAQTWTGTASNVNKAVINDTTFISAASAGLIEEFKTGGIAFPAGTWAVTAVVMSARALGGSAGGPTQVAYVTRVGTTDYVGRTWAPPVGSFGNNANFIQATNPGTGSVWIPPDLTAATFNYGVQSVT